MSATVTTHATAGNTSQHSRGTRLTLAAQALAGDPQHILLARRIAGVAAARHGIPLDDAEGAALLGLCDAARLFDPAKGFTFQTYAPHRIVGAIGDAVRSWRWGKRQQRADTPISLETPLRDWGRGRTGGERCLGDTLTNSDDPPEWAVDRDDRLEFLIRLAPVSSRPALRLLLFRADAITMKRAGAALNLTEGRISQQHAAAVVQLRKEIDRRGIRRQEEIV